MRLDLTSSRWTNTTLFCVLVMTGMLCVWGDMTVDDMRLQSVVNDTGSETRQVAGPVPDKSEEARGLPPGCFEDPAKPAPLNSRNYRLVYDLE